MLGFSYENRNETMAEAELDILLDKLQGRLQVTANSMLPTVMAKR